MTYLTRVISRGRIETDNEDNKEYWTITPGGNLPWFIRAVKDPKAIFKKEKHAESSRSSSVSRRSLFVPESNNVVEPTKTG